jgi:hypothetical protein
VSGAVSGAVPGAGPRERAVVIAGALAELGVQRVRVRDAHGERELAARSADLPGEVLKTGECTVEADAIGVVIRFGANGAEWIGENAEFERAMARAR